MAETTCLLNMHTWKRVSGVRIPLSPHRPKTPRSNSGFFYALFSAKACFQAEKVHKKIPAAKLLGFLVDADLPTGISPTGVGENPSGRARVESESEK